MCFTRKQCEAIDNKIVRYRVSASGYHKGFPKAVLFGPSLFGGNEWDTSYILQVYEKIRFFISHVRKDDRLGKLLTILVETIQITAGTEEQILNTEVRWTKWVETTWIPFLQVCLWNINDQILMERNNTKAQEKKTGF